MLLYVGKGLAPADPSTEVQRIAYPPGTGVAQLANVLEEKGIVRDARLFTYYVKLKGEGSRFQAGEYEMTPGMTRDDIIAKLNRGETVKAEVVRLTVPEGFTVKQVAEKLSEQGLDGAAFATAAAKFRAPAESWAARIPDDAPLKDRLEGYLFPETYEWKKDVSAEEMVASMVEQLDKRLQELPKDWQAALEAHGLSFHQLMTIASLIEREVVVEEERSLVSSVIHNRLKLNKQLEIDATVQYLLDKQKERLLFADLKVDSPYNTYLNKGLPPGPIASPSLSSIRAALYPAESPYLFYVTKKDGSKTHLFAETFEQHKRNIALSNQ